MTCKHEIVKCERKVSNIGSDLEYISDKINLPKIGLYIIGYFTVKNVLDLTEDLVIIVGDKIRSKLLNKAVLISQPEYDKRGRTYHAVSSMMEELLGISGSIQRSIPTRVITEEHNLKNLQHILGMLSL